MKYVVFYNESNGQSLVSRNKVFDDKYEAMRFADENRGCVIETAYYYKS